VRRRRRAHAGDAGRVTPRHPRERAVNRRKNQPRDDRRARWQTVTRRAVGEQQAGGEGRTQSERIEGRDDRRDGDRQRELPVELPGQPLMKA